MLIYVSGTMGTREEEIRLRKKKLLKERLISYFKVANRSFGKEKEMSKHLFKPKVKLFLDSGAFSAWSQKKPIDLEEYIAFIKRHLPEIQHYSVLDAIGDPRETLENQAKMELSGLKPLPCFHYGEPFHYLESYMKKYEYISLGGMVPIGKPVLALWLDEVFSNYICDPSGMPKIKVHGFGLTTFKLMFRYPWYSVDSMSWLISSRMGRIYIPRQRKGKWIFTDQPWNITVSNRSLDVINHIKGLGESSQKVLLQYLAEKGLQYGKSSFRWEKEGYELKEDEIKVGASAIGNKIRVEVLEERGVSNDYKLRDEANVAFFKDLEANFKEWPWKMEPKKTNLGGGFGL